MLLLDFAERRCPVLRRCHRWKSLQKLRLQPLTGCAAMSLKAEVEKALEEAGSAGRHHHSGAEPVFIILRPEENF